MGLTHFKRFRMEIDLRDSFLPERRDPAGYRLISWNASLLEAHAEAKYRCFRTEIDADVFPCLGNADGCLRLMGEISRRDGFLKEATWLAQFRRPRERRPEHCGTIQGVRERKGVGSIQNVGIVPGHRGRGLGTCLVLRSLGGFRRVGIDRVCLEVTAENTGAIRLYERIGFRKIRTVYKSVEMVCP